MKTIKLLLFIGLISISLIQCTSNKQTITDIKNGVQIESDVINLKVQFYEENIVRILKWSKDGTSEKNSLSVIKNEIPDLIINKENKVRKYVLSSEKLKLTICKNTGQISYMQLDGNTILKEKESLFTPVVYADDSAFSVQQTFKLTPDEAIYGLGQHQYGYMNYRNKKVKLVQTNTDAVNPFLVSTQKYGILWDSYCKIIFEDTPSGASLWSDIGDNIDYYLVFGNDLDEVVAGYRELTGDAPMYGKYAYGYWQSKEHYDTQDEIMGIAREYRKRQIPIDNMIQDWDYWNGAQNWSGMFFDKTLFPKPLEMTKELHDMNYHIIISIWPALGPNTVIYKDMLQKGFLYDPVGWAGFKYYDAFNPAANKLYWQYLRDGLKSKGIDGWWIDSTEPDVVNALTKESTDYEMKKVGKNYIGSWARYLNAFSLVMTDDLYKNIRSEDDKRPYILTRSTYAGQQRNAATTWSGDIGANWDVYKAQIVAGVNHCMSGIPYWTFDIGAFVIGAYDGVFCTGGKEPGYQELYTRMFQLGVFTPIFRSHGSETPREIWEMGEFQDVLIKYDNLRYRLMPYIYSLAWKVTNERYTIMRGLPMDFIEDKNTYNIDDQFMFGPSIMACPVTEFMYYRPLEKTKFVTSKHFKTNSGETGLVAKYYKDTEYKVLGKETIDTSINMFWYTGRPDYVTDSMFAIRWRGKLIPSETGKHQFHMKSFDAKRIKINGEVLPIVYTSVEQYTDFIELEAGKEYDFVVETENTSTGAARFRLFWKTPSILDLEKSDEVHEKNRDVYLPSGTQWYDFWTGEKLEGGQQINTPAPIETMPIYIKAGAILPTGPFLQYTTEKPADPIELRIYTGANGSFTLYEDENEYYNYENGVFATIDFNWNDEKNELTIEERKGEFPGMLNERTINVVIVNANQGTGIEITEKPDKTIIYNGEKQIIQL
ncbi:TIM-barrel domain-containing protein [Bacteroidota bacterium]